MRPVLIAACTLARCSSSVASVQPPAPRYREDVSSLSSLTVVGRLALQ
jgi:hypothetical protein